MFLGGRVHPGRYGHVRQSRLPGRIGKNPGAGHEEGDSFTAKGATARMGKQLSPDQWSSLGKKALERRKYHFALDAFNLAGDQENAERAREYVGDHLPPSRVKERPEEESSD